MGEKFYTIKSDGTFNGRDIDKAVNIQGTSEEELNLACQRQSVRKNQVRRLKRWTIALGIMTMIFLVHWGVFFTLSVGITPGIVILSVFGGLTLLTGITCGIMGAKTRKLSPEKKFVGIWVPIIILLFSILVLQDIVNIEYRFVIRSQRELYNEVLSHRNVKTIPMEEDNSPVYVEEDNSPDSVPMSADELPVPERI